MRTMLYTITALFLVLHAAGSAAQKVTIHAVDPLYVNPENIVTPGRAFMRRSNGDLIGTVVHSGPQVSVLYHSESSNDGRSWALERLAEVHSNNPSTAFNPSVDSNNFGKFVAYSVPVGGKFIGQVSHKEIGGGSFVSSDIYAPMTPQANSVSKSFIAASRGTDEWGNFVRDVGYGWVDETAGDIFVGHSNTGIEFPPARLIHSDAGLVGGVSIAVSGDFLLVVFHSNNKKYQPVELAHSNGAFPVLLESDDGGVTWTDPQPLFGSSIKDFPALSSTTEIVLAGGTQGIDIVANALAWERRKKGEKNIYVTSSIQPVSRLSSGSWAPLNGGRSAHFGIVSSRDFNSEHSNWRHAIVHDISAQLAPAGIQTSDVPPFATSFHQYSALPGSPVRTLTYLEEKGLGEADLVVGISTDSGNTYDQYVRANLGKSGMLQDAPLRFSVSQCLFGDPGGNVFIDAVMINEAHGVGLKHIKIPLGLNVKNLRD